MKCLCLQNFPHNYRLVSHMFDSFSCKYDTLSWNLGIQSHMQFSFLIHTTFFCNYVKKKKKKNDRHFLLLILRVMFLRLFSHITYLPISLTYHSMWNRPQKKLIIRKSEVSGKSVVAFNPDVNVKSSCRVAIEMNKTHLIFIF